MKWNSDSPILDSARRVVERLRSHGHKAFWVGGCVRDALLEIEPKDVDIATDALPETVREIFPKNVPVGAHFGVILVLDGEVATEVATCRSVGEYRAAAPRRGAKGSRRQGSQSHRRSREKI